MKNNEKDFYIEVYDVERFRDFTMEEHSKITFKLVKLDKYYGDIRNNHIIKHGPKECISATVKYINDYIYENGGMFLSMFNPRNRPKTINRSAFISLFGIDDFEIILNMLGFENVPIKYIGNLKKRGNYSNINKMVVPVGTAKTYLINTLKLEIVDGEYVCKLSKEELDEVIKSNYLRLRRTIEYFCDYIPQALLNIYVRIMNISVEIYATNNLNVMKDMKKFFRHWTYMIKLRTEDDVTEDNSKEVELKMPEFTPPESNITIKKINDTLELQLLDHIISLLKVYAMMGISFPLTVRTDLYPNEAIKNTDELYYSLRHSVCELLKRVTCKSFSESCGVLDKLEESDKINEAKRIIEYDVIYNSKSELTDLIAPKNMNERFLKMWSQSNMPFIDTAPSIKKQEYITSLLENMHDAINKYRAAGKAYGETYSNKIANEKTVETLNYKYDSIVHKLTTLLEGEEA